LVGGDELVGDRTGAIAVVRHLQRDTAIADRVVLHRVDDVPHLVGVADHRKHHALCAHVHGASDVVVFARGHTHDGRQVGGLEIADGAFDGLEAEPGVLEVE
jgi:hypothetical protein